MREQMTNYNNSLTPQQRAANAAAGGRAAREVIDASQRLAFTNKGRCSRWNISRNLACVCGQHK
jgi:hypothetical protein